MSAFVKFQSSIAASDKLIKMYNELRLSRDLGKRGALTSTNKDLFWILRSSVVASISALDTYIHTVLNDQIPKLLSENNISEVLASEMSSLIPIKNASSFKAAYPLISSRDISQRLSIKLHEKTLQFMSFQAPEKIIFAYDMINQPDIFDKIAATWSGPKTTGEEIKRKLANYVKRRNQIAHEGDHDHQGNVRRIQPKYANECEDFIKNIVNRLNKIVYP
ncbi:hypothetical protein AA0313_2330 [Acetobacter indonesiensis NRIC 0313]|uniref:HEPN domain-containing protein n=1 Tax=Acetobacter indonesiensis TaxID=104101 RepID=UPI000AF0BF3C|nr:HEPN domain-containing protein [Acetobacter indonesiensis]GBQ60183.1 hypothetical protein AA0313_2330 [Acetobacter indonesiensis NRIC 0313]